MGLVAGPRSIDDRRNRHRLPLGQRAGRGAFDGPLGVVSGLLAIDQLRTNGYTPRRPIAVVNFVDEEGARFGVSCAGSRMITGVLSADRARALRDADGITMAEAMRAMGGALSTWAPIPRLLLGSELSSSYMSSRVEA